MKPRNKFEKSVAASNMKLSTICPKVIEWAVRNVVGHFTFRTSGHKCTCGDCGAKFDYQGKNRYICCPHCGAKLKINDTLKRTKKESSYFATLETIDHYQVQRVFLLTVNNYKGKPMQVVYDEVCRIWLNTQGRIALTARQRTSGYYLDTFSWSTGIELRYMTDIHWVISDTYVYPKYEVIPELRRNGMKGKLLQCHPMRLFHALLTDHRIETMFKAGDYQAVIHFLRHPSALDTCWPSYKIMKRHGYKPVDYETWCDTIKLLERSGKDICSMKYICPADQRAEHDRLLKRLNAIEEKKRNREKMKEAKKHEAEFYREKSCYFDIVIRDNDLEITVLNSLEAYQAEGEELHHCVFQSEYYARPESLILSARDSQGRRIETVELSTSEWKVVQSRGVLNSNTEYHDRIIRLVNDNVYRFMEAKRTA